jgi:hypothetical protein
LAAGITKFGAGRQGLLTIGAFDSQLGTTLQAKNGLLPVYQPAVGTFHFLISFFLQSTLRKMII